MKFVAREIRRGSKYDAIVLDPPKFGRGPKNETWRFEENLRTSGRRARPPERPAPLRHHHGLCVRLYLALAQSVGDRLAPFGGVMEQGEMALPQQGSARLLPTALYARWRAAP